MALLDGFHHLDLDLKGILGGFGLVTFLVLLITAVWNVFFHPLSKFPGPIAAAISPFWIARCWNSGDYVHTMKELHDKYGPVVRISTNELSFCTASAWRDIYGHVPGRKAFLKTKFLYEALPGEADNVLSASDPAVHSRMRRNLSHGFSVAALSSQESLVQRFVDQFVVKIGENPNDPKDMVMWLNLITFDIIGKLAFGESFGNLDAGKPHFWLEILFDSIEALTFLRSFEYFSTLRLLLRWTISKDLIPASVNGELKRTRNYSSGQVEKRLQASSEQTDFLTKMIANRKSDSTSFNELQAQAELLILAGSETTATALSGIIFYLGRNSHVYKRLVQEIRTNHQKYVDISSRSTEALPYLKAVIEEGLRIFPPVPIGLPRVSPGETVDGFYLPPGTTVHVSSWSATHSETNFHKPFEFIPERWLDPDCKDQKSASQPFILGTRACLGRNMAMLEIRLILTKLLFRYDFVLVDDKLDWVTANKTFVFWKKPELYVKLTPREVILVSDSGMDEGKETATVS